MGVENRRYAFAEAGLRPKDISSVDFIASISS